MQRTNTETMVAQSVLVAVDDAMAKLTEAQRVLRAHERQSIPASGPALPEGLGSTHPKFYEGVHVEPKQFDDIWVSVDQAAEMLHLSAEQVRRNLRSGRLLGVPYGGRTGWRLARAYVEAERERRRDDPNVLRDSGHAPEEAWRVVMASFPQATSASRVLSRLAADATSPNAAVIRRSKSGSPRVKEVPKPRKGTESLALALKEAILNSLFGVGVGGALSAAVEVIADQVVESNPWGDSLRHLAASLAPETSALVVLVSESGRAKVEQTLLDAGGYIASAELSPTLVKEAELALSDVRVDPT